MKAMHLELLLRISKIGYVTKGKSNGLRAKWKHVNAN